MASTPNDMRGTGPYEILCGQCGSRFGWAALHPFLDEIVLDNARVPKHQRKGGFDDLASYQRPGGQAIGPTLGYPLGSSEWKQQSRRRIVATGQGRYTFSCSCGHKPVAKNSTLLTAYAEAYDNKSGLLLL